MDQSDRLVGSNVQNKFVAVGRGGSVGGGPAPFVSTMMYSSNRQNWTKVPPASFIADEGFSVAYSVARNQWMAVGSRTLSNTPQGIIATSTDAVTSLRPIRSTQRRALDVMLSSLANRYCFGY